MCRKKGKVGASKFLTAQNKSMQQTLHETRGRWKAKIRGFCITLAGQLPVFAITGSLHSWFSVCFSNEESLRTRLPALSPSPSSWGSCARSQPAKRHQGPAEPSATATYGEGTGLSWPRAVSVKPTGLSGHGNQQAGGPSSLNCDGEKEDKEWIS